MSSDSIGDVGKFDRLGVNGLGIAQPDGSIQRIQFTVEPFEFVRHEPTVNNADLWSGDIIELSKHFAKPVASHVHDKFGNAPLLSPSFATSMSMRFSIASHKLFNGVSFG